MNPVTLFLLSVALCVCAHRVVADPLLSEPAKESAAAATNPEEAEIARKKAKAYAEQKNWKEARDEAERATTLDPANADGWLILGTAEQRLEHVVAARGAFRKYLSMNPPADKAAAVRSRVAELEVSAEKQETAAKEAKAAKYGKNAQGLILGYAPLYNTKMAGTDELNHGESTAFLVGLRMGESGSLLFRYQGATIPVFNTSTPSSTPNASAKLIAMEGEFSIVLNDAFGKLHGFQFYVPISIQGYVNWISGGPHIYMNFGMAGGTGGGLRFYTGGPLIFDATFVHRLALPFGDVEWAGSTSDKALNAAGAPVKGNASGSEFRLSATIIF